MPVTYVVDPDRRLILTRCHGDLRLDEVLNHFEVLEQDPACPAEADVLLELSTVTTLPEAPQLRMAADRVGAAARRVRFRACAIVVGSEAMYGMIRMFEVFAEKHFEATSVVRTWDDAIAWLNGERSRRQAS